MSGFFNFTLQGVAIFTAIATIGIKVLILLRRIDRGFSEWQWQHLVMWRKFERDNRGDIPPYPRVSWDEYTVVPIERDWLGRVKTQGSVPPRE